MTVATIGQQQFILPDNGYDNFIDFLYNVDSQPELTKLKKRDIAMAYKRSSTGSTSSVASSTSPSTRPSLSVTSAARPTQSVQQPTSSPTGQSTSSTKRSVGGGNNYTELIKQKSMKKQKEVDDAKEAIQREEQRKIAEAKRKKERKYDEMDTEESWAKNYKSLKAFQAKNGNCNVPFGKDTGALRSWSERQKKMYATGKLNDDKIEKLNDLDFDFTVKALSTRSINAATAAPIKQKSAGKELASQ